MELAALGIAARRLPGAAAARHAEVDPTRLPELCRRVRAAGGLLVALWAADERDRPGAGYALHVALQDDAGLLLLRCPLPAAAAEFPSLGAIFPAAERMERAARDLVGVRAAGGDPRPWLRHGAWSATRPPLARDRRADEREPSHAAHYAFVRVEGDGVHEIPVGPVHAGIIEPGHFRFSVVGEKVLRLEARLGYVHKGIERRFESLSLAEGQRLAARVSGDSAVAFGWAYCMAVESLCGLAPPPRALALRALALERERIANHLGDLGALGNDAGFAFGLTQFWRLKEDVLRLNQRAFGARYPFDLVIPGGVAHDLNGAAAAELGAEADRLEREVERLRAIYDDHAGVQDRFRACGVVTPELAARLGLVGLAGRASSQGWDLRCDHPHAPYDALDVAMAMRREGDVAARAAVRFDEIKESLRLSRKILAGLPAGALRASGGLNADAGLGVGWVEGWRGPAFVALETDAAGAIRRCHPHDPSWTNWPALEHAVIGNIVPDFPLINKSFNLSYSGHDL